MSGPGSPVPLNVPLEIVDTELLPPTSFDVHVRSVKQMLARLPAVAWRGVASVDRLLGSLAGTGHVILHHFFRVAVVVVLVLITGASWESYVAHRVMKEKQAHERAAGLAHVHGQASAAKSRAREAKGAADNMLTPSFEPDSYSDANRLFEEASAALDEERFAEAERLFDQAAAR